VLLLSILDLTLYANGIIIFSTATLHAVDFKAENPGVWDKAPVLFSFYRSFLTPQVKYSVMLPQSQDFCKFYGATISNCNAGLADVKLREIYQNAFFF